MALEKVWREQQKERNWINGEVVETLLYGAYRQKVWPNEDQPGGSIQTIPYSATPVHNFYFTKGTGQIAFPFRKCSGHLAFAGV